MENTELVTQNNFEIAKMPENVFENLNGIDIVYPQLKIPAGGNLFWTVDDEPVKEISGVIVHHLPMHVYFQTDFDGQSTPPDCSSTDGINGKKRLDTEDGGTEFEDCLCSECPYNEFGSGKNGGKACKSKQLLYILTSGGLVPYTLFLPVSSLKAFNSYATKLFSKGKYLNEVITSFTLEKAVSKTNITFSRLVLKKVRDLEPEEIDAVIAIKESVKNG